MAPAVVAHLATQIGVGVGALDGYAWAGRSGRRHRVAIIDHLAVAAFDEAAEARFRRWLADDALPREFTPAALDDEFERLVRPEPHDPARSLPLGPYPALCPVRARLDFGVTASSVLGQRAIYGLGAGSTASTWRPTSPGGRWVGAGRLELRPWRLVPDDVGRA